jgi:protein O-GlcNAc transferase
MRDVFIKAMALHRAGQFREAEQGYRNILAVDPLQPDALHMLGVLAFQTGQNAAAVELISRAIAIKPDTAAYHSPRIWVGSITPPIASEKQPC